MAEAVQPASLERPRRKQRYWVEPLITAVVFGLFILYSMWEVLFHNVGQYQNYISPYFSPPLGQWIGVRVLPALYVMWVPFLFRATCYYYRREYYRAFLWDPPACAVAEPRRRYAGETRFPLNVTYLHRYFWYLAVIVLVFLWRDTVQAFIFPNGFGVGLGSLILLVNVVLLTFYTFSCHAFRHLVGGRKNCYSTCKGHATGGYRWWHRVSAWNQRHGLWAWASLFSVWGADLYVRLLIMGVIHDVRFF